jgi:acyl-homoserine-lactone acylase
VEIRRTTWGVPHVLAPNLEAAAFGLAWVMMEDYREEVPRRLLEANGRWAEVAGPEAAVGSFSGMMAHTYAAETFPDLPEDVREVMRGFAAGMNYFIQVHAADLPEWVKPEFTPQDVAARDLTVWDAGAVRSLRALRTTQEPEDEATDPEAGSNAWAFGPQRTRWGHAILLRNPHLSYTSGYYEAHVTVPGTLNFYGDFRLGGPFGIIGGFNDRLGWSTTNNYGDPDQVYALLKDPGDGDAYRFDGASVPIETRSVTIRVLNGDTLTQVSRDYRFTPLGPVLLEVPDTVFVLKTPALRQHRIAEQWLRMMQARNLEEWKEAMRIRAKTSSNFTYADGDGNIFYVWNASVPVLPHEPSDGNPIFAAGSTDVWTELYPWDSLPQLLNPRGGYLQNCNDPPYYTNLFEPMDPEVFPANFPEPRLRLRSQNSLDLIHNDRVMTLEEVVELKHSMRMMLAQRLKDDLLAAVRETNPTGELARAASLLRSWDNRASRDSRGSTLFELWALRYFEEAGSEEAYAVPWTPEDPTGTPQGLGNPTAAVDALRWAMEEGDRRFGTWDVTWGEVHRIRAGDLDLPVGGCSSNLGCFRVIGYGEDEDGRYRARTGDAWVLAVEFAETPRAYSVLAYGNSNLEDSPYFYNQAELFANNGLKPVAYTESDIQRAVVERYHPGGRQVP